MSRVHHSFRLASCGDNLGLTCTLEGLTLAGVPLLRKAAGGFAPRSPSEISVLTGVIGGGVSPDRLVGGLSVIATALNRGDIGRAMIAAIQLRIPDLSADEVDRIVEAEAEFAKYNPDEPRDWRGRWTTEEATAANSAPESERRAPGESSRDQDFRSLLTPVSDRTYPWVTLFRNQHFADALKLATIIGRGATADEVLAVSGNENIYGSDDKAKVYGNFFGIHSPGKSPSEFLPGQIGWFPTKQDGSMAQFSLSDGFYRSGLIFASRMSKSAGNIDLSDPMIFFSLAHSLTWGAGTKNYVSMVLSVYHLLRNSAKGSEIRS